MSDDLIRLLRKAIVKTVVTEGVPALLGHTDGVTVEYVDPSGVSHDDLVWARMAADASETLVVARNRAVPPVLDLPVRIADRDGEPTVVGIDLARLATYEGPRPIAVQEGPGIDVVGGYQVGLGGDKVLLYDDDRTPVAEYATITLALAAADSGDVVQPQAGTYAEDITIPAGVEVVGRGRDNTIIAGTVTLGDGAVLRDITVDVSGDDAGDLIGIVPPSGEGEMAYVIGCDIIAHNATGNGYCLYGDCDHMKLAYSTFSAESAGVDSYPFGSIAEDEVIVTDTTWRMLSLWNGSGNDSPPPDWETLGFDDAAWSSALEGDVLGAYTLPSDATGIWWSNPNGARFSHALFRKTFTLPAGSLADDATLYYQADDNLQVYVNGNLVVDEPDESDYGQPIPLESVSVSAAYLTMDGSNCIAIYGRDNPGAWGGYSEAFVAVRLEVPVVALGTPYVQGCTIPNAEGRAAARPLYGDRSSWRTDYEGGATHSNDWEPNASHHPKSHAHDGVDGSGTVDHANLTNVTSDQHHARAHNLDSETDHPDVDASAKADGYVPVWRDAAGKHVYEAQAGTGSYGYEATAGYAETIGDAVNTQYTVTHSLGTWDVLVAVWDLDDSPVELVDATVEALSADAVRLTFESAPATDQYRVLVLAANVGIGNTVAVEEADGTPAVAAADTIKVPNGTLTDNGDGSVNLDYAPSSHTHVELDITDLDHTDTAAIHDNVAGEIHAIPSKGAPADADEVVIEDSEDSWAKKRVALGDLPGGGGGASFPGTLDFDTVNTDSGSEHFHYLDLTDHTGDNAAHHAPVTVSNTGLSLSTQDLALNLAATSGLSISSGLMLADSIAGNGLTISSKVLAVGQGDGLTVSADAVALTTPGTLTHATSNSAAGNHTHAVTASSNPGAAASILASDATGYLQLRRIGLGTAPSYPLHVSGDARIEGGLNVGSATGAVTGEIKTSAAILGGGVLSLNNQSTTTYGQNSIAGLADEASQNLMSAGGQWGLWVLICTSDLSVALVAHDSSGTRIIADPSDIWRTTDSDGYNCVLLSGNDLQIKNRRGFDSNYRIHRLF